MAALANPFLHNAPTGAMADASFAPRHRLARLAAMHAEAVETARLANLLSRSPHVAIALPLLAALTLVLSAGSLASGAAWGFLVGVGTVAVLHRYARAVEQPFERAVLKAFAADLDACLLYAGFAWGAGAFLALPASAPGGAALAFALVPAIATAALLRESRPALFFLAPVAALTSLACAFRPFVDGAVSAVLVPIACGVLAVALHHIARRSERQTEAPLPLGPADAQ